MFTRIHRWLRAHWRPLVVHGFTLSAFLFYCFFLSGPIFDRFDMVEGESKLQRGILLPTETEDIQYNLHEVMIGNRIVEVRGWAFIRGRSCEDSQSYLVLESDDDCYIFDTMSELRSDVTEAYGSLDLNLDCSGLICNIPWQKIDNDEYLIGIYIRDGEVESFRRTHIRLIKSGNSINIKSADH